MAALVGQHERLRMSTKFNELGLLTRGAVQTWESSVGGVQCAFDYVPNLQSGEFTRTGPDGIDTYVALDEAGQVSYVRRGPAGAPIMEAKYAYYDDGSVWTIIYGNGPNGDGAGGGR